MSEKENNNIGDGDAEKKAEENPNPGNLRQIILDGLDRKGNKGLWMWLLFIFCLTPNILNGFHLSSYVFLGQIPNNYYCVVPKLEETGWTHYEIRNISTSGGLAVNNTCKLINWDYSYLSTMNYEAALKYVHNQTTRPEEVSCLSNNNFKMYYDQEEGASIVPEWDLICERTALRSTVQVALSVGKFIGASTFGVLADKYGRKSSFAVAAIVYMISGILTTFTPFYLFLLLGRMGLGAAASGVFYPLFTLLTENLGNRRRSCMSIAFNFSYPIGMIILAAVAYLVHPWRELSFALSVPSFLLIIHLIFLVESPRWLLSKGQYSRAYQMVFGRKIPKELCDKEKEKLEISSNCEKEVDDEKVSFRTRIKMMFSEFTTLYSTSVLRKRALICHFTWCITSLCYYVTALNADNLAANRYVYVATTGAVDIISYIISMIALRYLGRRNTSCSFFLYAGICLLVVQAVPKGYSNILVTFAMLGRMGITAVYAVMTLHTAELFPTEIRNTALGICSTMAHVGSISAPYIVDLLGGIAWFIPTVICGISLLAAGLLTLLQPETRDTALKDHAQTESTDDGVEMKK